MMQELHDVSHVDAFFVVVDGHETRLAEVTLFRRRQRSPADIQGLG